MQNSYQVDEINKIGCVTVAIDGKKKTFQQKNLNIEECNFFEVFSNTV